MLRQVVVGWEVLLIEVQALGGEGGGVALRGTPGGLWGGGGGQLLEDLLGRDRHYFGLGVSGRTGDWTILAMVYGANMERNMCLARPHPSLLWTAWTLVLPSVRDHQS